MMRESGQGCVDNRAEQEKQDEPDRADGRLTIGAKTPFGLIAFFQPRGAVSGVGIISHIVPDIY